MQLHQIKPIHKLKKRKRIARGGKRGNYSGRGIKGQKSRAGTGIRPAIRDIMMRLPKQRGRAKHAFKSLFEKPVVLNLRDIDDKFKAGEIVNPQTLFEKGIIRKKGGKLPEVKILGAGEISTPTPKGVGAPTASVGEKLTFQNVLLSESARVKIQKAGGTIK